MIVKICKDHRSAAAPAQPSHGSSVITRVEVEWLLSPAPGLRKVSDSRGGRLERRGDGAAGGHGGAEHHQDRQGEIEEDERAPLVQIPELAGHEQGGRQGDQLGQALPAGQIMVTITRARYAISTGRRNWNRCRPRSCRWTWARTRGAGRPRPCSGARARAHRASSGIEIPSRAQTRATEHETMRKRYMPRPR